MTGLDDQKREEALRWFLDLRDPATADWDGFTSWLEADPAHGDFYEEVALADGDYGALHAAASMPDPANDNPQEERRRFGRFAGMALVAVAMVGAVGYPLLNRAPTTYAIETSPGQRNSISLADGSRIELNGGTKITLRKGDARYASLDQGEATFTVKHDPNAPFTVHVGADQVQDVGTVFNIVRTKSGMDTTVASGEVLYNPDREAVRVIAGHRLQISSGNMALSPVVATDVASWRTNKLIYKDAPLDRVAADLSRNLGTIVRISPDVAGRRFSGVIMLGGDRATILSKLGTLLDVRITHEFDGWRMSSRIGDKQ